MATIKLQFTGEDDIASSIIQFIERGPYSHVDILLDDGRLLGARYHGGVQIRDPDYKKFSRKLVVDLNMHENSKREAIEFAHAQVGKPYDTTAVIGFLFSRDWRDTNKWYCSELAAAMLEHCRYFFWQLATYKGLIDPQDLLLVLSGRTLVDGTPDKTGY